MMILIANGVLAIGQHSRFTLSKLTDRVSSYLLNNSLDLRRQAREDRAQSEARTEAAYQRDLKEARETYARMLQLANRNRDNWRDLATSRYALSMDKADSQVKASTTIAVTSRRLAERAAHLKSVRDLL